MERQASPSLTERLARQLADAGSAGRLVVALSGGADSAALLAALVPLRDRYDVRALHVDHGLQGSPVLRSAAEAAASQLGVDLQTVAVTLADVKELGLEAAARAARYRAFAASLREGEDLLTAHHQEDQAETLLLQMLRGAGVRGLAAMPVASPLGAGRLLRPMLHESRAQLRSILGASTVPWVEDPSNADLSLDRNYLRLEVWPALQARWPSAALTLARSAGHLAQTLEVLEGELAPKVAAVRRGEGLDLLQLQGQPVALRREIVRSWLRLAGLRAPSEARMREIERQFFESAEDRHPIVELGTMSLQRHDGVLYLQPALPPLALPAGARLTTPGYCDLAGLGRLTFRLSPAGQVRSLSGGDYRLAAREGGERWGSAPGRPRRTLKDVFREARVAPLVRERAVLAFDGATLAAVLMPTAVWVAEGYGPTAGEPAIEVMWEGAPAALLVAQSH